MAYPLPQFRLRTLLWITLAVACWFGVGITERRTALDRLRERERVLTMREDEAARGREVLRHYAKILVASETGTTDALQEQAAMRETVIRRLLGKVPRDE